ncbi:50S ribosomal protein L19 [Brucella melitensis]|uniref:50S ribosomal protein L19 n=1 Tax=Brucella melitensis TaxID=29459 RepID=UPI000DA07214|nr:50S ribosomal protein L19 [Brucella melitensis]SPU59507.1 50S ribosomal protein L19 [Brucella melitensis]
MTDIIRQLEAEQAAKIEEKRKLPDFQRATPFGQVRVTEGTRTRVQALKAFDCPLRLASTKLHRSQDFYGEGVERVFPVYSPIVEGWKWLPAARFVARSSLSAGLTAGSPYCRKERQPHQGRAPADSLPLQARLPTAAE